MKEILPILPVKSKNWTKILPQELLDQERQVIRRKKAERFQSAERIYQDLVEEDRFAASYDSVKRFS